MTRCASEAQYEDSDAPRWNVQTSAQHPFSSQPPKIHATLSTNVTLWARSPCVGNTPYTGARLQCISVGDAGSTSFPELEGSCGVVRIRGWRGPFPSVSLPLSRCLSLCRSFSLLSPLSRSFPFSFSFSLSLSPSRTVPVLGDVERDGFLSDCCISTPVILSPAMLAVSLTTRADVRLIGGDAPRRLEGLRGPEGALAAELLARLARLLVEGCALNVVEEPECAECR